MSKHQPSGAFSREYKNEEKIAQFRQRLNQILTILRDVDCPEDIRIVMARDIADDALTESRNLCGRPHGRVPSCPICEVLEDRREAQP